MNFRIAYTFNDSLCRLTAQEQKAAKVTAFDLQVNPSAPGLKLHRVDDAKDRNFWSVRVNADIRIIMHRTDDSLLLCYVGHHDDAYAWAGRRKIEKHPSTGAMQLVELRNEEPKWLRANLQFDIDLLGITDSRRSQDAREASTAGPTTASKPALFDNLRKAELMSFGVPEEWVEEVRGATEDTLLDVIQHLPQEAQEALLKLAVGETPLLPAPVPPSADPFAHPDAQRRFRTVVSSDELRQALDYPWEKWTIFLHPAQREFVERNFSGPARVSGSAGTGKTVVAVHRAVLLARRNPAAQVLLTTYSKTLAHSLKSKVMLLAGEDQALAGRIAVMPITGVGHDLFTGIFGQPNMASPPLIRSLLETAAKSEEQKFSATFLMNEWTDVVDAWQITTWEAYAKRVRRRGELRRGSSARFSRNGLRCP